MQCRLLTAKSSRSSRSLGRLRTIFARLLPSKWCTTASNILLLIVIIRHKCYRSYDRKPAYVTLYLDIIFLLSPRSSGYKILAPLFIYCAAAHSRSDMSSSIQSDGESFRQL